MVRIALLYSFLAVYRAPSITNQMALEKPGSTKEYEDLEHLTCCHVGVVIRRQLRQAKVCHLGLEVLVQQDVAWLHISVDDARLGVLWKQISFSSKRTGEIGRVGQTSNRTENVTRYGLHAACHIGDVVL
jgi:hypothetical protein